MNRPPAILLDTTGLIDTLRKRSQRRQFLANLAASLQTLATSSINVAGVFSGLRPGEEAATRAFFAGRIYFQ